MVRFFGVLVGLLFVLVLLIAALMPRDDVAVDIAKKYHEEPRAAHWQQDGPLGMGVFGTYDRQQLQRGYQVYKEVCSACHSMRLVAFRNLEGIGFSPAQVKALAKAAEVPSTDPRTGEPATRPALPSDHFPSPYPNEIAARAANNNALPPDLSLIIKARHHGQRYVYSILTGYGHKVPADVDVPEGLHYNPWFASLNIAMAHPLSDGQVTYSDGSPATVDQYAKDVVAFLQWAAEPELERRRQIGVATILFLSILSVLAFITYRRVWAGIEH